MSVAKRCPCTSGRAYDECCAPYHRGAREPETPADLMRARFAAFARGDAAYLYETLHPDHEDRARPHAEVLRDLKRAASKYRYMGLSILDAAGSRVLFLAKVFEKGADLSFIELSDFAKAEGGWRYLAGTLVPARDVEDPSALTIATFDATR